MLLNFSFVKFSYSSYNEIVKTIFFGGYKYVVPILEVLRESFELDFIVTSDKSETDPVPHFAKKNEIEWTSPVKIDKKLIEKIRNANADFAVLAYFGFIIPEEVLEIFPKGIINIHPSLLPKYRGPTPGQTAILNGDAITGTTIIKLDDQIDHGPILAQKEEKVLPQDTSESLYSRLFEMGAELLKEKTDDYLAGKVDLKEQDDSKATLTSKLERQSGFFEIDDNTDVKNLDRMIRAYYPWPNAWTRTDLNGNKIVKFLPENEIQVEGKNPMRFKDFINGYPNSNKVIGLLKKLQDIK